jgi:hypothetical protein
MVSADCHHVAGVMLTKVNELIDETTATGPGKCHCCGEDLETAHLVGLHITVIFCEVRTISPSF